MRGKAISRRFNGFAHNSKSTCLMGLYMYACIRARAVRVICARVCVYILSERTSFAEFSKKLRTRLLN